RIPVRLSQTAAEAGFGRTRRMRQLDRSGRGALTAAEHASASDTPLSTDVHNDVDKAQLPSQTPQGGSRRVMGMSPSARPGLPRDPEAVRSRGCSRATCDPSVARETTWCWLRYRHTRSTASYRLWARCRIARVAREALGRVVDGTSRWPVRKRCRKSHSEPLAASGSPPSEFLVKLWGSPVRTEPPHVRRRLRCGELPSTSDVS